jgi:hypothetical protein
VYIAVYTEYKILKRIYEVVVVQQCVPLSALTHEPAQGIPQSIISISAVNLGRDIVTDDRKLSHRKLRGHRQRREQTDA